MSRWDYGGAYLRHPITENQVAVFDDGSKLKVHNIFDPLPEFMKEADLIFVDPPWNLGNLNTFYTKAGRTDYQNSFEVFYKRLFECIGEIRPTVCYVEVGKEYLADFIFEMRKLFKYVTFYNSTYYHRKQSICYVIRGSAKRKKLPLDYMDEEDIIAWVCEHEDYECIGDLCMGQGLVGIHAHKNGKRFVGTELNPKRLSVLLEKLSKNGCTYQLKKDKFM
jgi:DNA modification methylase